MTRISNDGVKELSEEVWKGSEESDVFESDISPDLPVLLTSEEEIDAVIILDFLVALCRGRSQFRGPGGGG